MKQQLAKGNLILKQQQLDESKGTQEREIPSTHPIYPSTKTHPLET